MKVLTRRSRPSMSFVASVSDFEVVAFCCCESAEQQVRALGGRRLFPFFSEWKIRYSSEDALASLLSDLRDHGFAMAGGAGGWPPTAVFEQLRDNGKVIGRKRPTGVLLTGSSTHPTEISWAMVTTAYESCLVVVTITRRTIEQASELRGRLGSSSAAVG